jgi:hypothetical protein
MTDVAIGKFAGMSYHDVRTLPREVYEVILDDLHARAEKAEA